MASITISGPDWVRENPSKTPPALHEDLQKYFSGLPGMPRGLQLTQKIARLGNEIIQLSGKAASQTLKSLDANLGIGAASVGLFGIPKVTKGAIESVSALDKKDGIPTWRKACTAFSGVADAISAYAYLTIFVIKNSAIRSIAEVADFAADSTDLVTSVHDYNAANKTESRNSGKLSKPAKEALSHSKTYYMLRVAKAVVGVSATVLSFVALALGSPLLPPLAWICLGVTGTMLAITRDVFKNRGHHPVIPFDRPVQIL